MLVGRWLQISGKDAMDAWISLPSGAVLALLAILVWLATVTIELVGILSFLWAMFSITDLWICKTFESRLHSSLDR